jgi:hypothetical protein
MRAVPQYRNPNPRFQLRTPPIQPISVAEYRRIRQQQLGFIAKLMQDLMSVSYGQPKRNSEHHPTQQVYVYLRDQIAKRQQGLAHIRKQLAVGRA